MSIAKRESRDEIGHLDTSDIKADPLFYHTSEKEIVMHDMEADEDPDIRLILHVSRMQAVDESDELSNLRNENARLRIALGEPLGVLSEYAQKAYVESLPGDIDGTLDFKQSYFETLIANGQAKLAESRLILKFVMAEKTKRRAALLARVNVDRSPLTDEEHARLNEFDLSKINRDLEEAYVYGDRMKHETICLKEALEPFSEAFQDWLDRPEIESNADFGDWIRQYLKKKNMYVSIRHWFERAADLLAENK